MAKIFSQAFNIQFLSESGQHETAWTTSWGASTRLIGGLVMTHSDDNGLVLPPRIAPSQVILLPVQHRDTNMTELLQYCATIAEQLTTQTYAGQAIRVHIDKRELRGGEKAWHWVKKGAPIRLEIGPRELAAQTVSLSRRDQAYGTRETIAISELNTLIPKFISRATTTIIQPS